MLVRKKHAFNLALIIIFITQGIGYNVS